MVFQPQSHNINSQIKTAYKWCIHNLSIISPFTINNTRENSVETDDTLFQITFNSRNWLDLIQNW